MAKVTSKLQITLPKAIAEKFGIRPGDDLEFTEAGDVIRVLPPSAQRGDDIPERLRVFDAATERARIRERQAPREAGGERGWSRAKLYDRARTD